VAAGACLGDFDPPVLDSPRDPNNSSLPASPSITAAPLSCQSGFPRVRVSWTIDSGPEIGGFQVYRSTSQAIDPGLLIASLPANARDFEDGGRSSAALAGGSPYWYRVRTLNTDGIPGLRSAPDSVTAATCQ
jgi:hypothetical protein